jgi:hypothetical protein
MRFRSTNVVLAALVVLAPLAACSSSMDEMSGTGGAAGMSGAGGSAGAACVPSGAGGSGTIPATFATVKLVLGGGGAITPCASAPCHAVGGMAPANNPLTLQDPDLYAHMLSYVAQDCDNMKLVNPGKPDQSALIKILNGPCGAVPRMPYQCSDDACIPPEYITAVSQWIANCAPEQ